MKKVIGISFGVVGLLVGLFFLFQIKEITVEGNTFYPADEVGEQVMSSILDHNILTSYVYHKIGGGAKIPYANEYEITYKGLHTAHIKLYEKSIVAGILYSGQYVYFDHEGYVLLVTQEQEPDIPLFETENLTKFGLYQMLALKDEKQRTQLLSLANLLKYYKVDWNKISFDENNQVTLECENITIDLSEKEDYDEEIVALADVLKTAKEKGLSGTIDMTDYHVKGDIILKQNK